MKNEFAREFLKNEINALDYILSKSFQEDEQAFKEFITQKREVFEKAIESLENQIVKAPEKTAVKTWWGIPYKAWCCPVCGTPVKNFEEHYCPKCGQKLRGEEHDERTRNFD